MPIRLAHTVLTLGLPLLIAACGESAAPAPTEADPYANGASYPWSYAAPGGEVVPLTLTPGENTLQDEPVLAAKNGWGPIERNRSNGEQAAGDGRTLSIGGQTYARGFGVHAGSEMRFSLGGTGAACTRFTADIGVDDEVGPRGKVAFQVYLDGTKAYDSGPMRGKTPAKQVALDITGKQELRLVVTDGGNGINYDHADWAEPKLYCQAVNTTPASLTLDQNKLEVFHRHTGALRATFAGLSGPVDLRLEVEDGRATGLELQTGRVELPGGSEPVTRELTIAAPGLPGGPSQDGPDPLLADYRLIASQNGQDVASAPLTVLERPLAVRAALEPAGVSSPGVAGDTRRVTVVLRVSPPLDAPVPLDLVGYTESERSNLTITAVGPVYGTGGEMRQEYDLTLKQTIPQNFGPLRFSFYVGAGDFAGYRLPYYGTSFANLSWNLAP